MKSNFVSHMLKYIINYIILLELNIKLKTTDEQNISLNQQLNEQKVKHDEQINSITEEKSKLVFT